jgi:zinc protease
LLGLGTASRARRRVQRTWIAAALGLGAAGLAAAPAAAGIFPYTAHVDTLDNGLVTILVPMHSGGLVAYWSIVRTGARDEYEPGHTGFAHFFEHMMFRGSEKYPRELREKLVTQMGADTNAYTTDDLTGYYLNIAAEDLEKVIDLESDRFKNLKYPEEEFKTEAGAVYGEYRKNLASPFFTLYEALHKAAYDVHTYGHTAMGYPQDIEAMPSMYKYSLSFFERYYRPENVVILVVGDFEPEATRALLQKYYGDWQRGYKPPHVPAEPEQRKEKRIEVPYQGQSLPIVWAAYKIDAFDPTNRDLASASLLSALAFGETSAIHKKLVLDEQVVEFIEAEVNVNRDPGLLDITTRVKVPDKVDYVLGQIDATIAQYQAQEPDPQRLADLKSRLKYEFLMGLDTPMNVARSLARIIAVTGGIGAVDTLYDTYAQVTPADVQAAARKYLLPKRRTIAVLRGGES